MMKKFGLFLLLFLFVGCSTFIQSYKPNIVEVEQFEDIPLNNFLPVYLNSVGATGLYYMEVEYTSDIPEIGWVAINSGSLIHIVVPAYPKPSSAYRVIGVAKEPAYKVLNQ